MALTLAQKDALTTNATFLGRVRQAVRDHAAFIVALAGGATAAQKDWKNRVFGPNLGAAQIAANLAGQLVTDPAVANSSTGDGSDVTDANLKSAVDTICEGYN